MTDAFDPYYKWLSIPPEDQPPHHYRLLGVKVFETDEDVIAGAADRQMAHVRSFQSGKHAAESQMLLNDLSAARICLLAPDRKAAYDQELKTRLARRPAATTPQPTAVAPKPLRIAQPVSAARPTAIQATPADPLGFDPLVEDAAPRHRKSKRTAQPPMLLAGVGAMLAVVGLIWILTSGGSDQPEQIPTKQTAAADRTSRSEAEDEGQKKISDPRATPESNNPPSVDRSEPEQTTSGDSTREVGATTDDDEPSKATSDPMPNEVQDIDTHSPEPSDSNAADTPPRTAMPDAAAFKAAIAEVQSLLKAEFSAAKKPDQKIALAEKLLGLAKDSDSPVERFALLSEAKRLAISAGAADLAMRAIDALSEEFEVDRLESAAEAVDEIGGKELPTAARKELVEIVLPLVEDAAASGQFKLARRLATAGLAAARKANANDAAKTLARQTHDLAAQEKLAESAEAARKLLEAKPDDAEAHLTLGKYLCLVAGDWDAGLRHLQQGSDASLRNIAEREMAGTESATDRMKLGDLWWDLSDDQKGTDKDRYRARAGYWYEQAVGELTGLSKTKVEKRLADLPGRPVSAPATASRGGVVADKLILWNCRSVGYNDRGTRTANIELRQGGKVVWSKSDVPVAWSEDAEPATTIQLPKITFDAVRVQGITFHGASPALCEVEIFRGRENLAWGKPVTASGILNGVPAAAVVDGVRDSSRLNSGYWIGPDQGWVEVQVMPAVTPAPKSGTSKQRNGAALGKWINLLPLVDPAQQHLEAAWERNGGELHVKKPATPIQIPRQFAGDYTLHVEFTRKSGDDAVYVLFPTAPSQTAVLLSGWGGQASGMDGVNGGSARDGITAIRPGKLENDHRYNLDITVRHALGQVSVDVDLDRKPYVRWKGDPSALGFTTHWMPRWDTIGLAANEPTIFHVVKLNLLSGPVAFGGDVNPRTNSRSVDPPGGTRTGKSTDGLLKGAVLIATFDEPTIIRKNGEVRVRDFSGKQKPGLVVGADFVPGKSGHALGFESTGYVDWGDNASLNPPNFTFCTWIKPTSFKNVLSDVFSKHGLDKGCSGLVVRFQGDRPRFGIGIGDGHWHFLEQGISIPLDQWAHVAATHDNSSSAIYINGQLAKSARSDGPVIPTSQRCLIGRTDAHDELQFYGQIDELALFDRSLSAAEVEQIYQLGAKGKSLATVGKK